MQNPLPLLALLASLAPLAAVAQNSTPPGYTFGGMFPGMFGNSPPPMPGGFMNNGQSPFLTMPAPQTPYASPHTAPAARANPMAQPIPFWMQTPASPQGQARYITEVPRSGTQRGAPAYTVFSPRNLMPMAPPRWAPLHGQSPAVALAPRPTNNWAISPNGSTAPAPAVPATPPKWPTP